MERKNAKKELTPLERAIKTLREKKVRWIHSGFTDVRGLMQDVIIPVKQYTEGKAFSAGIPFDGSSVRGYKSIDESDMILMPDPKTLAIIPWNSDDEKQKSAIMLGDVYESYGATEPSEVCPRGFVGKRAINAASDMGYQAYFGPELEFFVFKSIDPTKLYWDP